MMRLSNVTGVLSVCLAALLAAAGAAAEPRARPPEAAPAAKARPGPAAKAAPAPSAPACQPDRLDAAALKSALIEHDAARQAFRNKFQNGRYGVPGWLRSDLMRQSPAESLARVAEAAVRISGPDTGVLVYASGLDASGGPAVCVWLVGARGLLAAAHSGYPVAGASVVAQQALNVTVRALSRSPVRKGTRRRTPTPPPPVTMTIDELSRIAMPPPIEAAILSGGIDRLLVLPVKDLGVVPWPALKLGGGQVVDHMPVVVLADVDWVLEPEPVEIRRGADLALLVGDPDLSRDGQWDHPRLPGAREEVMALTRRYAKGHRPLVDKSASLAGFKALLRHPEWASLGLIYFATHGISDAENPMDGSFLALSGGHLFGRDIKALTLTSRPLVVMSACQTGLGKVFDSGVFGLARAWWQAGARQVVMSLWNVDDEATKNLMVDFFNELEAQRATPAGEQREEALRNAMLKARARDADPALWAGFTVFGLPTPQLRLAGRMRGR